MNTTNRLAPLTARQIRTANDVGEADRRRAQALAFSVSVDDVGAAFDANLAYAAECHDVACTACGSPFANTHTAACPAR